MMRLTDLIPTLTLVILVLTMLISGCSQVSYEQETKTAQPEIETSPGQPIQGLENLMIESDEYIEIGEII